MPVPVDDATSEEKELAFTEGKNAYYSDYDEWANPYEPGTILHEWWSDGYDDAMDEALEND